MVLPVQWYPLPGGGRIAYRSSRIREGRPTILLLHGLGDSSLAWEWLLHLSTLDHYTLIAPDLAGFGETGQWAGSSFGFADQVRLLGELLNGLEVEELILVGHSMSGVIGGWLAAVLLQQTGKQPTEELYAWTGFTMHDLLPQSLSIRLQLCGFVNVEGTLAQEDASISHRAVQAAGKGRYDRWYRSFLDLSTSLAFLVENPGAEHYHQSVVKALPEAFLASARDLDSWKVASGAGRGTQSSHLINSLDLPCNYLYGSESVLPGSIELLTSDSIEVNAVKGAGHWLMNQRRAEFEALLLRALERFV